MACTYLRAPVPSPGPRQSPPAPCGLTVAVGQQQRVDTLPHRAVDEGLAGQRLVQRVLQGVAALDLPVGHDVVHQVALRLHVTGSSDLFGMQTQRICLCKEPPQQPTSAPASHTPVLSRDNCPQLKLACFLSSGLLAESFLLFPVLRPQAPAGLTDRAAWSSAHPRARPAGKALPDPPLPTLATAEPIMALLHASAQLPQILHTRGWGSFTIKTSILPSNISSHSAAWGAPRGAKPAPTCPRPTSSALVLPALTSSITLSITLCSPPLGA